MAPAYDLKDLRVAMCAEGTRGDCQPYVALCLALRAQGCVVKFLTNSNHDKLLADTDLDFVGCFPDYNKVVEGEAWQKAMLNGDTFQFIKALGSSEAEHFPDAISKAWPVLEEFKPHLVLCGILSRDLANIYCHTHKIPRIVCLLQSSVLISGETTPFRIKCPPFSFCRRALWRAVWKASWPGVLKKFEDAKTFLGQDGFMKTVSMNPLENYDETFLNPFVPLLFGVSPEIAPLPKEYDNPNICATGWWVLNQEQQTQRFLAGDPLFGGRQRDEIVAFLEKGTPPVYIGWGSMTAVSPKFMTDLAVSALKKVGQRGIVSRGWAKLDPELLDDDELKDYAKKNILFIETAPHEWLLPKCIVQVIHGGSGTTASCLRSGKPTIITPVFLDQYDFADSVVRLGCGVSTVQMHKVTTTVLADALKTCLTDQQIRKAAAELQKKLVAEDGIGAAIQRIKGFVEGPLSTGEWQAQFEQLQNSRRAARGKSSGWSQVFNFFCCPCKG